MQLYVLADDYRRVMADVEDAAGELTPELEARLDAIEGDLARKIDSCCALAAEREREAVAIQAEIDRLKARQATANSARTHLKAYVKHCLERAGVGAVTGQLFAARIQASPPSARWTGSDDAIPDGYRREKHTVDFDAKAALADDKLGLPLPEGIEITRGTHLIIR